MNNDIKKKIFEFLNNNKVAVISTIHVDKDAPESAVVGFAQTEALELIYGTSNSSRKYKNLQSNQNVSLVIGFSSESGSIQYEGVARELTQDEMQEYAEILIKKNPYHKNFINDSNQKYFLVKPKWIRFMDNESNPPGVHEVTL